MAFLTVPIFASEAAYSFELELESLNYTFTLQWNKREAAWHLGLSRLGTDICWVTLRPNVYLLNQHRSALNCPPGDLILYSPNGDEPAFDNFGENAQLLYVTSDEVADIVATPLTFVQ